MADSSSRTQIAVAFIGVMGVVAAAVFSNWDKIFPPAPPQNQVAKTPAPKPDTPALEPKTPDRVPATETLGDAPDAVMFVSASPPPGTHLRQGQIMQFTVKVRYRLTTIEKATLTVTVGHHRNSSDCTGIANTPVVGQADIVRGEDVVTVIIPWTVGLSKDVAKTGSVDLGAMFWSDIQARQMFRNFGPRPGYCYPLD